MSSGPPAILVRDLRKSYGELEAVRGIDFEVAPGEVFGLLGPNGAGKTTTVEILEGYRRRSGGIVSVLGFDPGERPRALRERVGIVLQSCGMYRHVKVHEAVSYWAGMYPQARDVDEVIEIVGLTEKRDALSRTLSGGQARRLDLALALVHSPRILFLDEPTTGLDPQSRSALWQEVGRLAKEEGVTVFLTTQYLEEADVLADRVGIIDHGRIVAEGTPAALKAEIGHPTLEVVPADPEQRPALSRILAGFGELTQLSPRSLAVRLRGDEFGLADVVRALDAEELHVEHLQLHAPSLDDVFLAKTGRTLEGAGAEQEESLVP